MPTPDARAWVLARFARPDADDLDATVRDMCDRDPWFALLLKQKIAERVEIHHVCPSAPPGRYRLARGALRED